MPKGLIQANPVPIESWIYLIWTARLSLGKVTSNDRYLRRLDPTCHDLSRSGDSVLTGIMGHQVVNAHPEAIAQTGNAVR